MVSTCPDVACAKCIPILTWLWKHEQDSCWSVIPVTFCDRFLCLMTAQVKTNLLCKSKITFIWNFILGLGHSSVTWPAEQRGASHSHELFKKRKLKEKSKLKTLTVTVSLIYLVFYRSLNGLKSTSFPITFLTVGKTYSMSKCMWTAWGSASCKDFTDQSLKSPISCSFYNLVLIQW